jgi:ABC-2 type transport system ATP-binding protein
MSASSTPPTAALRAVDLVKTYPGARGGHRGEPVRALDGLSIEIEPGTVFALLGRNGAGKSTTVKILTTLARPDSGTATVAGIDILRDQTAVRRAIGLVSQKSSSDPMATGRENLVLAGRIQGLPRSLAHARATELLRRFDLTAAADRLAKTYSGGMARKLDVALGLVHRPKVLFLDEPTTGLDPEARAEMWAEIARLSGTGSTDTTDGTTVLLTTHYLEEADQLADRVAIVDAGRVIVDGTPEQLKSELRGDTVLVELTETAQATALGALDRVIGLREIAAEGTRLRARADNGARAVPAVVAALESADAVIASVTVARPSLDDVYLRHVGHAFRGGSEGRSAA